MVPWKAIPYSHPSMCHHLLIFDQSPKSKTVAYCIVLPCLIQESVLQHGDHVGQAVEGLDHWTGPSGPPSMHCMQGCICGHARGQMCPHSSWHSKHGSSFAGGWQF